MNVTIDKEGKMIFATTLCIEKYTVSQWMDSQGIAESDFEIVESIEKLLLVNVDDIK